MKLNTKSAGLSVILMLSFILCHGQTSNWVRQVKGSRESFAFKVLSNDSNFIYVTGVYEDSAFFAPGNIFYSEKNTSFLAKYDLEGNVIWVKSLAGPGRNSGGSIAIDNAGFIYLYGGFELAASLGAIHFTAAANYDQLYLIKLNQNGVPIWGRQSTGVSKTYPNTIVINNSNQIYLTGTLFDKTTFIDTTVTPTSWNTPFIARLDTDGHLIWFKVLNGTGGLKDMNSATTNSAGDIFFCGTFTDNLFLDSIQLSVTSYFDTIVMYEDTIIQQVFNRDYFLGQIDSTGKILWAVQSEYLTDEYAHGLATDNSGGLYITGGSEDSLNRSIFIARHNQHDGALSWIKFPIGCGEGYALASVDAHNMYVTGSFCGSAKIGGYEVTSKGYGDIFIMNFDSSGKFKWITAHGAANNDYSWSICESKGSIYIAGGFIAEAIFGNITVTTTHPSNRDAFVAKLDRDFLLNNEEVRPEQRMLIYPNPFNDQITISTSLLNNKSHVLSIFDITGREVFNKKINSSNNFFTINTGNLGSGIYMLALYGDEVSVVEKIVKQ